MARRIGNHKLESRTTRLKLKVQTEPYYAKLDRGLHLGYRRNEGNGTFSMRVIKGKTRYLKILGPADDFEGVEGALSFFDAQAEARKLVHGGRKHDPTKPLTVLEAVDEYKADLMLRGGEVSNATRVAGHLDGHSLATKIVATLTARELTHFRTYLLGKGLSPGGVTRTTKALAAALNLAAKHDPRISNREAFRIGLEALPGSTNARRAILKDEVIQRLIAAAAAEGPAFALFHELLAVTGQRPVQLRRLQVADLLDNRLLVPRAKKGRNRKRGARETRSVPISAALAMRLRQATGGRPAHEHLLLRDDGTPWTKDGLTHAFSRTVQRAGLDKSTTSYALRHSAIVRMLLKGVPLAIVSDTCDTSERQIRAHYARYISDHSDELVRGAMLQVEAPAADNVMALR